MTIPAIVIVIISTLLLSWPPSAAGLVFSQVEGDGLLIGASLDPMGTQWDLLCDIPILKNIAQIDDDDDEDEDDDEMDYSLAPLQDHNETICVMYIRENIGQSNVRKAAACFLFQKWIKKALCDISNWLLSNLTKLFSELDTISENLFGEHRSKQVFHFNFELNYFQFPSVVQMSSNDPTIWSDQVDLITSTEVEASEGIDAEIAQIIAPTQRQYRVVSVESRT